MNREREGGGKPEEGVYAAQKAYEPGYAVVGPTACVGDFDEDKVGRLFGGHDGKDDDNRDETDNVDDTS